MVHLTRQQVREVDRLAIERYHIPGIVLMENAARGVAAVALRMLPKQARSALILCGGGNNGGDGLAVARHLHNREVAVTVALCVDPGGYRGDALINWRIVEAMGLAAQHAEAQWLAAQRPGLIVDAIFGTGLEKAPRAPFPQIVEGVEAMGRPVLAVDLPSGLDCDSGEPLGACMRAARTVTFVARKAGFRNPRSREFTGIVSVADIGCPRALVDAARR